MSRRRHFQRTPKQQKTSLPITVMDIHREHCPYMLRFIEADVQRLADAETVGPFASLQHVETSFRAMVRQESGVGRDLYAGRQEIYPSEAAPPLCFPEIIWMQENNFPDIVYLDAINLALAGERVLYAGEAISQHMAATAINLPISAFKVPFASFALSSTASTLIRAFLGARAHTYRPDMSIAISITLADLAEPGMSLGITSFLLSGRQPIEQLKAKIHLPESGRLSDAIDTFLREAGSKELLVPGIEDNADHLKTWFGASAATYYRIIINLILYSTMPKARISAPLASDPRPHDLRGTRLNSVYQELGVGLAPIKLAMDAQCRNAGRKEPTHELAKRVLVIGHWRAKYRQAHLGDDAELTWIEPYWKGPESAPVTNRPFEVAI